MGDALNPYERFKERVVGKIDAARGQCWLLHRWTRWEVTRRNDIVRIFDNGEKGKIGQCVLQERRCSRCGKTDVAAKRVMTV